MDLCNVNLRQSTNNNSDNNSIEEVVMVHHQHDNQQVMKLEDDGDDDDDRTSFTYPSSGDNEYKDNQTCVAKELLETPQLNVSNQVTGSSGVNIDNTTKYICTGKMCIKIVNKMESNLRGHTDNLEEIGVVSTKEGIIVDQVPEKEIALELSNSDLNQIDAHTKGSRILKKRLSFIFGVVLTGLIFISLIVYFSSSAVASWFTKKRIIAITGAIIVGIVIVSLIAYFLTKDSSCDVCIVKRDDWHAEPPDEKAKPLAILPAKYVIIIHTKISLSPTPCFTQAQCVNNVQQIQKYDMKEVNKTDIRYNWLVGGDGNIYECRGWDVEGDHTKNFDDKSIGIGFIGTFQNDIPTNEQIESGKKLIEKGVEENHISKNYILVGHRQCLQSAADSPGDLLQKIIEKWPNWSPACF